MIAVPMAQRLNVDSGFGGPAVSRGPAASCRILPEPVRQPSEDRQGGLDRAQLGRLQAVEGIGDKRDPVISPVVEAATGGLGEGQPADSSIANVRVAFQQAGVAKLSDERRHGVSGHTEFGRGRRHRNSRLAAHHPEQLDLRAREVRRRPGLPHGPSRTATELAQRFE